MFDRAGISVATVQYAPFRVSPPRKLFRGQYWYGVGGPDGFLGRAWDFDSKKNRFLMITLPSNGTGKPDSTQVPLDVTLNWFEELRQRVPKH